MEDQDEATLFLRAVNSRYFADVFDALDAEYAVSSPAQQVVLRLVRTRFEAVRDLLDLRLRAALEPEPEPEPAKEA